MIQLYMSEYFTKREDKTELTIIMFRLVNHMKFVSFRRQVRLCLDAELMKYI